jgi:hypothetical protein
MATACSPQGGEAAAVLRSVWRLVAEAVGVRGAPVSDEAREAWGCAIGDHRALVFAVAKRIGVCLRDEPDLLQAAHEALRDVAEHYDSTRVSKGRTVALRTYAWNVVERRMREERARVQMPLRVPPTSLKRARARARALERSGARDVPSTDQDRRVAAVVHARPLGRSAVERAARACADPARLALQSEERARLVAALGSLRPGDRALLSYLFALDGGEPGTPTGWARRHRTTAARAEARRDRALRRLRRALADPSPSPEADACARR